MKDPLSRHKGIQPLTAVAGILPHSAPTPSFITYGGTNKVWQCSQCFKEIHEEC